MLDSDLAAPLGAGSGLVVGTVAADGEPRAGRAWAATVVDAATSRLRVLVGADDEALVVNAATTRRIAVTGADVRTLRAVQVKGLVVGIERLTSEDVHNVTEYTESFFRAVEEVDSFSARSLRRLVPHRVVAIDLIVDEVFDQSPGPRAGTALAAAPAAEGIIPTTPSEALDAAGVLAEGTVTGRAADELVSLEAIERCFGGAVPAILTTASSVGIPNVTYLSRAHRVGDDRIALSNQFMSKTSRNLVANPRASLLLIDPRTHDEYRLSIVYERTERRGHVFDRLRTDVDAIAALTGMQDVFRLRAADIFRIVDIVHFEPNESGAVVEHHDAPTHDPATDLPALAELAGRLGRCGDLDVLVDTALEGLDQLFGYRHAHLLLLDEEGRMLYTIASRGFDDESIGAEVPLGDGLIGTAAARGAPMRVGNLMQMAKYSRSILHQFEDSGGVRPGRDVPMPGLRGADSRLAVPTMALGELVGVLVVDSTDPVAFGDADEQLLSVVASMIANAIEHMRDLERSAEPAGASAPASTETVDAREDAVVVRYFAVDGSVFLDADYLIKGVAGRILWSLLRQHESSGRVEFTNKELRLDPSLEMPGFKDNLESRLILLKRRLDERQAPVRIEKSGRGRFSLHVTVPLGLTAADV